MIRSAIEIRNRYNFDDTILKNISVFSVRKSRSFEVRKEFPSLVQFSKLIPRLTVFFNELSIQLLDDEWRQLPSIQLEEDFPTTIQEFWVALMELKNSAEEYVFKVLPKYVLYLLSLPHSNADCERILKKMNLIKANVRNKLITKTVHATMTSELVKRNNGNYSFAGNKDMIALFICVLPSLL